MIIRKASYYLLFALLLSGCATTSALNTPTGKPEVTISGVSADEVASAIINKMIDSGYNVTSTDNRMLVFEKPLKNFVAMFVYGSNYDRQPNARITFNINQFENKTRVVASFATITNPGSAFEKVNHSERNASMPKYQEMLNEIKASLEKK